MSDRERNIVPSQGGGMLRELGVRMKLILRLIPDSRVTPLLKLLPVGTLVYLIVPDLAIGPIDDAVVIWLGSVPFVELWAPGGGAGQGRGRSPSRAPCALRLRPHNQPPR